MSGHLRTGRLKTGQLRTWQLRTGHLRTGHLKTRHLRTSRNSLELWQGRLELLRGKTLLIEVLERALHGKKL